MKNFKTTILLTALLAGVGIPVSAPAQNMIQELAAKLLGDKFGIPIDQILSLSGSSHQDVYELAPVYSLSKQTHRPANEVWRLRQEGLGWGQVAHKLGMHPGTFNKMRNAGSFDRDRIWGSIYQNRYGASSTDIAAIRRRGGSNRDILPALVIARSSRTKPVSIYDRYRKDRDWNRVASTYKVDFHRGARGGPWNSPPGRWTEDHGSKGKGHAAMKIHGAGKANGKGHGRGAGPGKDWGQRHGKGKGQGGDNGHGNGKGHGGEKDHGQGHGHGGGKGHDKDG